MITGTGGLLLAGPGAAQARAGHNHAAAGRHARAHRLAHHLLKARTGAQVWTVASVSGPTIVAKARIGTSFTITTTTATTFQEAGSTVALTAVQPNEHIRVLGTRDQATKTIQAKRIVIVLPSLTGVVTGVNGATLTVTGRNAVRYTITIGGSAKIEQAGLAATPQAITVGSLLTAQGTMGTDGTFTALRLMIRLPQYAGTISAVNGASFTLRTRQGKTYTITPASAAVYVTGRRGAAPTTATTAPTFTVGERVQVVGSLSADGATLTALRIRIAPAAAAQPVPVGTSTSGA
jgi:hypothetical protein